MTRSEPLRILLAKVGLDGHDRGVKVVARGLRDAGHHVIYAGLWQSPDAVVQAALDEDVDWIGLSILSGAHMKLIPRVIERARGTGLSDLRIMVGGIIPAEDVGPLIELGVSHVFGPGTSMAEIDQFLREQPYHAPRTGLQSGAEPNRRAKLAHRLSLASRGEMSFSTGSPHARVTIITGGGGVGKSTLIGRLIELIRHRGESVAVLACDPQSSLTGGALLGDRIRMPIDPLDQCVLIRSLATPAGGQSIAPHLETMIQVLSEYGFDNVIVETAGAGQGDTAARQLSGRVVVLVQPQTGDELQWEKAGQLEIADVVVVHKSDLPGAEHVESQLRETINSPGQRQVPVVRVSSGKHQGLEELWAAICDTSY